MDPSRIEEKKRVDDYKKFLKEQIDSRLSTLGVRATDRDNAVAKARMAYGMPYQVAGPDGKPRLVPLGLTDKAHKLLLEYIETLAKPGVVPEKGDIQDIVTAMEMLFQLDLQTGNLWELKEINLKHLEEHPGFHHLMFFYHGASGDYAKADKELEELDRKLAPQEEIQKGAVIFDLFTRVMSYATPSAPFQAPLVGFPFLYVPRPNERLGEQQSFQQSGPLQYQENLLNSIDLNRAERLTMRGILALEAGKTIDALAHFRAALKLAGPTRLFVDRGVAERYKQLLESAP